MSLGNTCNGSVALVLKVLGLFYRGKNVIALFVKKVLGSFFPMDGSNPGKMPCAQIAFPWSASTYVAVFKRKNCHFLRTGLQVLTSRRKLALSSDLKKFMEIVYHS